jgi:hypothetical protein
MRPKRRKKKKRFGDHSASAGREPPRSACCPLLLFFDAVLQRCCFYGEEEERDWFRGWEWRKDGRDALAAEGYLAASCSLCLFSFCSPVQQIYYTFPFFLCLAM